MPVAPEILLLAIASGAFWGAGPIFSMLGMRDGGDARQATLIVLVTGAGLFWVVSLLTSAGGQPLALGGGPSEAVALFAVSGVVGTSLAWLLWFHGIDRVGASVSNVVFYTQPLFAIVLAALFLGERLTPLIAVGAVLIVAGVGLVSLSRTDGVDSWSLGALAFPLASAVFAAVANVINRLGFRISTVGPLEAATINLTSALPLLVGYTLLSGNRSLSDVGRSDLYFVGSGLTNAAAVLMLFAALERGPVVVVTPLVGTSPLFTTVFAHVAVGDAERVTRRTVLSAALTVAGVAVIAVV